MSNNKELEVLPKNIIEEMKKYPVFYQKVWTTTFRIPRGETRTYGWVAERIGHPRAARAVGMALKSNPFVPIIPCHRVTRSDGSMGGYSGAGGISTKMKLLKREGALK